MCARARPSTARRWSAGNSVYFPDRVVPMLPERISNDLCSLRPGGPPGPAVRMVVGPDGHKKRHSFHRVMMRSAAKVSYSRRRPPSTAAPDEVRRRSSTPILSPLWAAYEAVTGGAGQRASPLALDLPERKILLKPDGTVDRLPRALSASMRTSSIEEFMILANVAGRRVFGEGQTPD
jgi:ribonuclease R